MEILNDRIFTIENNQIWPLTFRYGGYLLRTWLMRLYNALQYLMQSQKKFNKTHSSVLAIVKGGFGILKSSWHCLLKRLDSNLENLSSIVITCVVLHIILQFSGDNDDNILKEILNQEQHIRNQRRNNNGNPDPNINNPRLLV